MTESLYKRKKAWEKADKYTRLVSKMNRKIYCWKKVLTKQIESTKKRKTQQKIDHELINVFKKEFPEQFKEALAKYQKTEEVKNE